MNEVFADTSGWASFFREQERYHAKAVALMTQWQEENRHTDALTTDHHFEQAGFVRLLF